MADVRWRKVHELTPWDAYALFRMRNAAALRGGGRKADWQARFARLRPAPIPPHVRAEVADGVILLHPERPCSQLQLGILAASLANLRVTNARDGFDLRMPLRLLPLIGTDAFTKPNSWRSRRWRVPLELAWEAQPYPAGWNGLAALLAGEPQRLFTGAEIAQMAARTIAATLTGAAAEDFWRANR